MSSGNFSYFRHQSYRNNHEKVFINIVFISHIKFMLIAQDTPFFISDSLDIYVNRAVEQWQIPGAAVLIYKRR